jgi:hypothetical protein
MSAFVVTHEHIAAIVGTYCAMREREEDSSDPLDMAKTLLRANLLSVDTRYPNDARFDVDAELTGFTVEQIRAWEHAPLSIGQFFSALACYTYNACEPDSWHESDAFKLCNQFRSCAEKRIPDYFTCPWRISESAPLRPVVPRAWELERATKFAAKLKPADVPIESNAVARSAQQNLTLVELRDLNTRLAKLATACLDSLPPDARATLEALLTHFTVNHVLTDLASVVRKRAAETIETEPHRALELNRAANLVELMAKRISL